MFDQPHYRDLTARMVVAVVGCGGRERHKH